MIVIDGREVKGTHGLLVPQNGQLVTRRRHFIGVKGEAEVRSKPRGRQVSCDLLVHDNYAKLLDIETALEVLQVDLLGRHGNVVTIFTDEPQVLQSCTYMGFELDPAAPWPLYDYAGTIDGGWWIRGTLMFYQLIPSVF